jgi:DNA-binding IclR family transcriptional regulator
MGDPFDLTGKVAIVTGAGSGIGQATAQRFAERGATVVGLDVKTADVTCDVSARAAVHELVAVGAAAAKRELDVVAYARDEMQRLADELGVEVVASAAGGEEIVMLARAGEPRPLGVRLDVGQRLPLVPPLGTVFVAWSPPDEIDRWLRRVGASATDADLERYRAALDAVRRRGYLDGLEPAGGGVRPAAAEMVEDLGHQEYVLLELDRAAPYRPMHMAAPVFGPDGSVAMALTLIGFRGQLRVEKVPEIGERLLDAARTVTKAIGGVVHDE